MELMLPMPILSWSCGNICCYTPLAVKAALVLPHEHRVGSDMKFIAGVEVGLAQLVRGIVIKYQGWGFQSLSRCLVPLELGV